MSGVAVIRALLVAAAPVTNVVPAPRIMAGDLPINTAMPAIAITQVSGTERLTISMVETPRMHTERVQVSVLLKNTSATPVGTGYPGVKALLALVLAACPNQHGTMAGVDVDSILPDQVGPDLQDDVTGLISQSHDFIVKYRA